MDGDAERRLEERLDRWTSDLRDALVRIEAKLDAKAAAVELAKLQDQHRALELDFAAFKARVITYGAVMALIVVPGVTLVMKRLGL